MIVGFAESEEDDMTSRLHHFFLAKMNDPFRDYHNHSRYPEFLFRKEVRGLLTPATKSLLNTADIGILLTRYPVSLSIVHMVTTVS